VATILVATGCITAATLQIKVKILTVGKSGHAHILSPKCTFTWAIQASALEQRGNAGCRLHTF